MKTYDLPDNSMKKEKTLDTAELWSKNVIPLPLREDEDKADWIRIINIHVQESFLQHFIYIKGNKFNWLVKLWCKLNSL